MKYLFRLWPLNENSSHYQLNALSLEGNQKGDLFCCSSSVPTKIYYFKGKSPKLKDLGKEKGSHCQCPWMWWMCHGLGRRGKVCSWKEVNEIHGVMNSKSWWSQGAAEGEGGHSGELIEWEIFSEVDKVRSRLCRDSGCNHGHGLLKMHYFFISLFPMVFSFLGQHPSQCLSCITCQDCILELHANL